MIFEKRGKNKIVEALRLPGRIQWDKCLGWNE